MKRLVEGLAEAGQQDYIQPSLEAHGIKGIGELTASGGGIFAVHAETATQVCAQLDVVVVLTDLLGPLVESLAGFAFHLADLACVESCFESVFAASKDHSPKARVASSLRTFPTCASGSVLRGQCALVTAHAPLAGLGALGHSGVEPLGRSGTPLLLLARPLFLNRSRQTWEKAAEGHGRRFVALLGLGGRLLAVRGLRLLGVSCKHGLQVLQLGLGILGRLAFGFGTCY